MLNIYNAYFEDKPVTDSYVTFAGEVKNHITLKLPLGMTVKEALDLAGGVTVNGPYVVINGGPMMGRLVDLENDSVTKTTKGLLIFPETHSIIQRKRMPISMTLKRASAACCNCTMCSDMCPRNLLGYNINVHKTVRAASHSEVTDSESFLQSALCCGCGVCTVIGCQQMLDPQKISMDVKGALGRKGLRRQNNQAPQQVRPERASRLVSSSVLIDRLGIRKYVKAHVERKYIDFAPNEVYIELKQHVGKPASATVKVGDKVKVGDVVAQTAYEDLGTTMHASIDGKVKAVTDRFVIIER